MSNYPYEIMATLELKDRVPTLGPKDPGNFILHGKKPRRIKLEIYEDYIRKVAPEYAATFEEHDAYARVADFIAVFNKRKKDGYGDTNKLVKLARFIEQYVFVTIEGKTKSYVPTIYAEPFGCCSYNYPIIPLT